MRFFRDSSLQRKTQWVIFLAMILALIGGGALAVLYEWFSFRKAITHDLSTQAAILNEICAAEVVFNDPQSASKTLAAIHVRPEVISASLYDKEGQLFAFYARANTDKVIPSRLTAVDGYQVGVNRADLCRPLIVDADRVGTLCLSADMQGEFTRLKSYVVIGLFVMLAALLLAAAASFTLQRTVAAPILALAELMKRVTEKSDYSLRVEKSSRDEVGILAEGFNQMLSQIQKGDEELRASEERFRQLAETINEVFWLIEPDKLKVIYINPAYEGVWGRTCASLYAAPTDWIEAVHPDDQDRVRQAAFLKLARGDYDEEYRILRPDGSIRWIHDRAYPLRKEDGTVYRIAGIAEDITARKQAEESHRAAERLLQQILDNTAAVVYVKSATDGRYLLVNRQFETIFHLTHEKVLGKTDYELFDRPAADKLVANDRHVCALRQSMIFEEIVPQDNKLHTYISVKFPMLNEAGEQYAVGGVSTDVSDRRHLEKLVHEISNRELSRIGQDLHDGLCQHLVAIAFMVNALEKGLTEERSLGIKQTQAIAESVDQAITQARLLARSLFPVCLEGDGLEAALHVLATDLHNRFKINCTLRSTDSFTIDKAEVATNLYRIIQEAATNAAKHSQAAQIVIELRSIDGAVKLSVRDDGVGLTENWERSTGMGLHLMRYRANLIGATLNVDRSSGGGTVVTCLWREPAHPKEIAS